MDERPIGVFDSGLGGLTVVKELIRELPGEGVVYFGDTARIPYGTRSREAVTRYSAQCIRFLLSKNIKMVVVACNTASSISLNTLREEFDIPILGVIDPGAEAAVKATRNKKIGVIGTQGTIRSGAYHSAIKARDKQIQVVGKACTLFVPIVEEGWSDSEIAYLTAQRYLDTMKNEEVDTVLLGCTHYPLLTDTISRVMGPDVRLVNPAVGTALQVKRVIESKNIKRCSNQSPTYSFNVSDFGQKFQIIGSRFLNRDIKYAGKIDIERY